MTSPRVNAYAVAPSTAFVLLEAVNDGEVDHRPCLPGWKQDLRESVSAVNSHVVPNSHPIVLVRPCMQNVKKRRPLTIQTRTGAFDYTVRTTQPQPILMSASRDIAFDIKILNKLEDEW